MAEDLNPVQYFKTAEDPKPVEYFKTPEESGPKPVEYFKPGSAPPSVTPGATSPRNYMTGMSDSAQAPVGKAAEIADMGEKSFRQVVMGLPRIALDTARAGSNLATSAIAGGLKAKIDDPLGYARDRVGGALNMPDVEQGGAPEAAREAAKDVVVAPIEEYRKQVSDQYKGWAESEFMKPVDEGYVDTAYSFALGGLAGAGGRKWAELGNKTIQHLRKMGVTESLFTTGIRSGLVAATGDKVVVDPAIRKMGPWIDSLDVSDTTKELMRATLPIMVGFAVGMTGENALEAYMGSPMAVKWWQRMAERDATPEEVIRKYQSDQSAHEMNPPDYSPKPKAKPFYGAYSPEALAELNIKNPHRIELPEPDSNRISEAINYAKQNGHDGVVVSFTKSGGPSDINIAFDPKQAKPARPVTEDVPTPKETDLDTPWKPPEQEPPPLKDFEEIAPEDYARIRDTEPLPDDSPIWKQAGKSDTIGELPSDTPAQNWRNTLRKRTAKQQEPEEAIFIRKATAKEKPGGTAMSRALANVPQKEGYEPVYKPYGNDGKGIYYSPRKPTLKNISEEVGTLPDDSPIWNRIGDSDKIGALPDDTPAKNWLEQLRDKSAKPEKPVQDQASQEENYWRKQFLERAEKIEKKDPSTLSERAGKRWRAKQAAEQKVKPETEPKEPWQMTREEYTETQSIREDSKPETSFKEFVAQNGGDTSRLAQDRDIANVIGGAFAERTKAGRGKLKAPINRIAYTKKWEKQYKKALENGEINQVKSQRDLDKSSEMDLAYIRSRHHREIRKALSEGRDVPDSVLKDYPDLAPKAASTAKKKTGPGETTFQTHPATVWGVFGASVGGLKYDDDGKLQIDYEGAIKGGLGGFTAGLALPVAFRALGKIKNRVTNESIRYAAGWDRTEEMGDMVRNFERDAEVIGDKALQIGKEIRDLAPTPLEQKRFLQVLKGGRSTSPKVQEKAVEIQKKFSELRQQMKELELMQYSRFDDLTRKERAGLRKEIKGLETKIEKETGIKAIRTDKTEPDIWKAIEENLWRAIEEISPKDAKALEIAKNRLNNYYHYGSAEEYAPIFYSKHDGLSKQEKKVFQDEIDHLKKRSRSGNPEGDQQLESMIAGLEDIVKKQGRKWPLRRNTATLDLGYTNMRQDIPHEVQRMMGIIESASYTAAKGLAQQGKDMRQARLLKDISENPMWVYSGKKQPERLNFIKVSGDKWGALDGKWVRNDIKGDMEEAIELRGDFIKHWDKWLSRWKSGKVIWNPATHSRNIVSNVILAYFGDVNPADAVTYGQAFKAVKQGPENKYYKEMEDWGLFAGTTFHANEIAKYRDEIEDLRSGIAKRVYEAGKKIPGEMYGGSEKVFKSAVFIKARKMGLSVDEAARKAERFIFNYSDIPPWVRHAKRWLTPFLTFSYKAIPLAAQMTIEKPHKMALILGGMYGMEEYARQKLGLTHKGYEQVREAAPEWTNERLGGVGPYAQVMMPFTDRWGDNLFFDLSYILPFGSIGEAWGQSQIPLRDFLPTNPLLNIATAMTANRDPFVDKPIYNKILDSGWEIRKKQMQYIWRQLAPTLAPGGYGFNKLWAGAKNSFLGKEEEDWAGRKMDFGTAVLHSVFGLKLNPAYRDKLDQTTKWEILEIERATRKEIGGLYRDYQRNKISKTEFEKEKQKYQDLLKRLVEQKTEVLK